MSNENEPSQPIKARNLWVNKDAQYVFDNPEHADNDSLHVIEAAPVLERIKELEDSLQIMRGADRDNVKLVELLAKRDEVIKVMREALVFLVERENLTFAECSIAEEIWGAGKEALEKADALLKK